MRRIMTLLMLMLFSVSCTVFNQVRLEQETVIYDSSKSEANAVYTIPSGCVVYLTGRKKYKKIKYGIYQGWAYNPSYTTSSSAGSTNSNVTKSYSTPSSDKTVQVKGYYRKDGTYVRPHTRSAPRRK